MGVLNGVMKCSLKITNGRTEIKEFYLVGLGVCERLDVGAHY